MFDKPRWLAALALLILTPPAGARPPLASDDRLVVELVAGEPDIVTPTGLAVDERGRVWVIENHTHQRTPDYRGPASDRVRVFDLGDNGKVRRVRTFADGFRDAMSLALGPAGAVYLATRADVYRLRDTDGDGVADERKAIVRLKTAGNYPHNGLAGFAFDPLGEVYFALGENLGAPYELIGSDGVTLTGGGEGGSIYRCRPDGTGLVRVATGFWNTFHLAVDAFGRLFAVDNDPDSRGPCRLLHIVQGGDYGYRYRNGRKGLHPFTAWNGELPGTLPMVAGTAEGPSGIVAYESTGLPAEYRGNLLVTSWGDHVVERFALTPCGASFAAKAQVLLRGDEDFRPVAIAVGPDGALYLSDWVDKSYPVHAKGRIWRVRMKQPRAADGLRPSQVAAMDGPKLRALLSNPKREVRAAAGEALARNGQTGFAVLAGVLETETDTRARIEALWAAAKSKPAPATDLITKALGDRAPEIRAEAAHLFGAFASRQPGQEGRLLELARNDKSAFVRMQAILQLQAKASREAVVSVLTDPDPFLAGAALEVLGRPGNAAFLLLHADAADAKRRLGVLLALRRTGDADGRAALPKFFADADPDVRRAAIQWVGEDRLRDYAPLLKGAASRPPVTRDVFETMLAAEEFLAGVNRKPGDESSGQEYSARIVGDASQPPALRTLALRMLRPDHLGLSTATLRRFLGAADPGLRREAVRTLALRADAPSQEVLRKLAADGTAASALRADAVLGLAHSAPTSPATRKVLVSLLNEPALQVDVLRSLRTAVNETETERTVWDWWGTTTGLPASARRELAEQLRLALRPNNGAKPDRRLQTVGALAGARPRTDAQWRAALAGQGDAHAGERVFFHSRGARCFACHRIDGRGGAVGPDLSTIGRSLGRDKLIDSVLAPGKEIAPQFVTWQIVTRDGKVRTGVVVEEGPHSTITVADAQGKLEVIHRTTVEERNALPTSLMPDNLHELMTLHEFRDLVAFLQGLK